jgi:hypothetical protein
MARRDLAKLLLPTAERRMLHDQVRAAADTLGMPSLRR